MPIQPIKLLSSMATRELLSELTASFERQTGQPVALESAGGVDVARRVRSGESADVVVLASNAIDQLIDDGNLLAGSRVDLVRSGIAVAIRKGGNRPDIATEGALRQAVMTAQSLGYSTGPSGQYLVALFERWGIWQDISERVVQAPAGIPVATLVARGDVELGFQQLSELAQAPGIEVLGPLPREVQSITVFSAAVCTTSGRPQQVRALLDHLVGRQAEAAKRRHGMEPA